MSTPSRVLDTATRLRSRLQVDSTRVFFQCHSFFFLLIVILHELRYGKAGSVDGDPIHISFLVWGTPLYRWPH